MRNRGGGEPTRIQNHQGIPTLHQIDWESLTVRKTQQFGEAKDGFVFHLGVVVSVRDETTSLRGLVQLGMKLGASISSRERI